MVRKMILSLILWDSAKCEKELYSVKGATHANSLYMNPDAYWNKVFKFINDKTSIAR